MNDHFSNSKYTVRTYKIHNFFLYFLSMRQLQSNLHALLCLGSLEFLTVTYSAHRNFAPDLFQFTPRDLSILACRLLRNLLEKF